MSLLRKLPLALTALVLASFATDAQAGWNRRISDIRIVHPPGSPPGIWRVTADVGISGDALLPGPLSFDCALFVNGTIAGVVTVPIEPNNSPTVCPGSCSGGCSIAVQFGVPLAGSCSAVGGCHCEKNLNIDVGNINGASGTDLLVMVTPTIGSLPEIDTSDDFMHRTIGENNPGTVTCAGDGTGTACPCANSGASGRGCANSSNPGGAQLSATGFTEASPLTGDDSVVLHVDGMPSGAPLLYFQGTSNALNIPFGDGTLCTTGSIIRLRVKINVGGASQFPEPGDPSVSVAGGAVLGSAATLYYQAYYRDSGTFCTASTFNMTNGISLTWY